jgi:hypothetical protein
MLPRDYTAPFVLRFVMPHASKLAGAQAAAAAILYL